jgi:antirestriction protein ArdC
MPTLSPTPSMTTRPARMEHEIPYMKGYTVFNVEQMEGLPEVYYATLAHELTHNADSRIMPRRY